MSERLTPEELADIRLRSVSAYEGKPITAGRDVRALLREIDALREEVDLEKQMVAAIKHSVVATVGGVDYEGNPTSEINYLQRLRILVEQERKPRIVASNGLSARLREMASVTVFKFGTNVDVTTLRDAATCIEQQQAALEACRPVIEARVKKGHLRECGYLEDVCDCGYAEACGGGEGAPLTEVWVARIGCIDRVSHLQECPLQ